MSLSEQKTMSLFDEKSQIEKHKQREAELEVWINKNGIKHKDFNKNWREWIAGKMKLKQLKQRHFRTFKRDVVIDEISIKI